MERLHKQESTRRLLIPLLALLALGAGYGFGRQHQNWHSAITNPPSEDRDSFCRMEWIIDDFHGAFRSNYFDWMRQAVAEKSAWLEYQRRYEAWLQANRIARSAEAWEGFQKEHGPAPPYEPKKWAAWLDRQLEKLESGDPAPILIRDLLRLRHEMGDLDEVDRLLTRAQRRHPEHFFAPDPRTAASSDGRRGL